MLGIAAMFAVKILGDRNIGMAATPQFKFQSVPSPVRDDAAAGSTLTLIAGSLDSHSAALTALTDGAVPTAEDQPAQNVFFKSASWCGRVRMGVRPRIDIAQINSD